MDRTLQRLLRDERGFTVIELMLTMVILAILILIALPAYLQYRDDAYQATAESNVKDVVLAAGLYYEGHNGSYFGMAIPGLRAYDARLASATYVNNSGTEAAGVTQRAALDASHYCVYAQAGRWFAYQLNPNGSIFITTVASAVCT
jgi:prepilin-type N-terminal cleavage/methylation domain-containing protein